MLRAAASEKTRALLLTCILLAPLRLYAEPALLGRVLPDGRIRFERVEDLVIDGNRKVKLAAENLTRVEPADAKSLQRIELSRAGLLRGDGKGRIYRVNGDGSTDRIIPEDFALKMSIQPRTAQIPLSVSALKERKGKDAEEIDPRSFYFFLADPDPDRATLRFVLNGQNFPELSEQLRAIEGFAWSLPDSAVLPDLKHNLQARLTSATALFEDGGPYPALLVAETVAASARRAFPADPDITKAAAAVDQKIESTQSTERKLLGLAAIEDWGTYLSMYRDIEVNSDSFPQLQDLHHVALEERTRELCLEARALVARHQDGPALEDLSAALKLDPENPEIPKLVESTRQVTAQQKPAAPEANAPDAKPIKDPDALRQFREAMYYAQRAIQDHDLAGAEESLKKAEKLDPTAPELLLTRASLLSAAGNMLEAVPLLDRYDALVTNLKDREKAESIRNQLTYELRRQRESSRHNIETGLASGDYMAVYQGATAGLKFDPNNPALLYAAGTAAAILRKDTDARPLLDSYLVVSDSLAANQNERRSAREVLRLVDPAKESIVSRTAAGFSRGKSVSAAYYSPLSLAFGTPFDSVNGFKLHMAFQWQNGHLLAIRSDFDDEKGRDNYRAMAARNPQSSRASEGGNFTFVYDPTRPFARAVYPDRSIKNDAGSVNFRIVRLDDKDFKIVDSGGNPQLLLPGDPSLDLNAVSRLLGPAATIVSGNSFFNPFIWDGIHYFTATYDNQGRVSSAREWNADNLVKFNWDGVRLLEIAAFHGQDREAYYRRTISYAGNLITSEEYQSGAHGGRISYKYSKGTLVSAKIEDTGVHDGKTWLVHFSE